MINIKGVKITLRAVEPSDVELLYAWENDLDLWGVSETITPFSHHTLKQFIEAQQVDIFTSKQLRLMICDSSKCVGALDIFDFDPINLRAGVGVLIERSSRKNGYALDALQAVEQYAAKYLRLHQLWCNIEEDNTPSINLFTSLGYHKIGVKRDWISKPDGFKDEIMLQKILK